MKSIDDIFNENAVEYHYKIDNSEYDLTTNELITKYLDRKNVYKESMKGYYFHKEEDFKISCTKLWQIYFSLLQYATFSSTEVTNDETMSYDIFLNMNSKGKPLTFFDIFSAKILIKISSQEKRNEVGEYLKQIKEHESLKSGRKGEKASDKDNFLYASWKSRSGDGNNKSAASIKTLIHAKIDQSDDDELIDLVKQFVDDLDYYHWAIKPAIIPDKIISDPSRKDLMERFSIVLNKQIVPLKMSFSRNGYEQNDFYKLHKFIEGFWVFFYGLTETAGSKTETFWIECCKIVNDRHGKDADEVLLALIESAYKLSGVKTFNLQDWCEKMLSPILLEEKPSRVSFLLRKIEYFITPSISSVMKLKDPKSLNVEHILPQNLPDKYKTNDTSTKWDVHFGKHESEEHMQNLWLLGNMTLLNASPNRKIRNYTFGYKCEHGYRPHDPTNDKAIHEYKDNQKNLYFSTLNLNVHDEHGLYTIYHSSDWTPEAVKKRTRQLIMMIIKSFDIFGLYDEFIEELGWGAEKLEPTNIFKEIGYFSPKSMYDAAVLRANETGEKVLEIIANRDNLNQ